METCQYCGNELLHGEKHVCLHCNSIAEEVTVGQWIIQYLLLAIPIFGIIRIFLLAFGNKANPSLKSWAQAGLILILISITLSGLLYFLAGPLFEIMGGAA
jgi:hypothetical protein